ncbi:helix-turn-helix domain-containing protein [Phenylobacterium sp.]|uniref:helix-turn-helix domain-containing protein n=1 Tax=Phenylobacterium sp. TaxID=1871053 RepID=UPI0035ADB2B8
MFNPARLSLARRRQKLTKKALADIVGCDVKTLIRYESAEAVPPDDSVEALADALGFPASFFEGSDIDEPTVEAASFRSLSSMPARERDGALAAGALAFLLNDWLEARFDLPEAQVPEFKEPVSPEAAAAAVRTAWGLGERPVRNMVHLLEAHGVRVFSLAENTKAVDAFSMWRRDRPFVFLNTFKTPERSRFDAAHELGHLVMHRHGAPQGRGAEDEANQFASAFLMPPSDVKARHPRVRSLNEIIQGKTRWGVSVAALNYRLHRLGATTDWQYRQFCIQIAQRFQTSEPNGRDREISAVLEKVFEDLRGQRITKVQIANDLALPVSEIDDLVFRLSNMQSIEGGSQSPGRSRAKLTVVE